MNIQKYIREAGLPVWVTYLLVILGALFVLLLIFDAGIAVGSRRAMQFHEPGMMGRGPQIGFGGWGVRMPHGFVPRGHGAVGVITDVSLPLVTVEGRDGTKQQIMLDANTRILGATSTLLQSELHSGQEVVIVGDLHDATSSVQLKAELIRVLPPAR